MTTVINVNTIINLYFHFLFRLLQGPMTELMSTHLPRCLAISAIDNINNLTIRKNSPFTDDPTYVSLSLRHVPSVSGRLTFR